jgi:hypothetical protein
MTTSLKSLFSSLVAGDLLKVYVTPPLIEVATMFNVTVVPVDPLGNNYQYFGTASALNGPCNSYHLGANLELSSNPALLTDADVATAGIACRGEGISGGVVASNVTSASDIVGTDGASNFYDIRP